jgi:hypothetical protein
MTALAGALVVAMLAARCSSGPAASGAAAASGTPALLLTQGDQDDFGRNSPQFHAADAACRHPLPPGITDDGSGP